MGGGGRGGLIVFFSSPFIKCENFLGTSGGTKNTHFITPIGLKHFVCNGGVFVTYRNMNTFQRRALIKPVTSFVI